MYQLVYQLLQQYPNSRVGCHNEFAAKACPSFKRETFLKEYEDYVKAIKVVPKCILK